MVAVADRSNQPIFPEWSSPTEWPWPITIMVSEARRIIGYFELPDRYRPPKMLWHSADKCAKYIENAMEHPEQDGGIPFSDTEIE